MNIRLPGFVIAELYKDSLVIIKEKNTSSQPRQEVNTATHNTPTQQNKKWFLGENKKNIIIIIKDNSVVFINDEWLPTLTKLLSACKLQLDDVAIINYLQHPVSYNELKELQPRHILMFDVSTQEIGLPFTIPHYQIQQYANCTFMTAAGATLSGGKNTISVKAEKTKLWEKLKTIFTV